MSAPTKQTRVVIALGSAQTLAWGPTYFAGNGILTIAKGTLSLAIFGPSGYGLRHGLLMVPARFGQAGAPFLFALLMECFGASALFPSTALGLAGLAALFALTPASTAERV